ncbi:MAG: hypothetical protein K6G40_03030 [Eubacterium sp.]|nr:hypothetical protein [Eubacterium sp.]
MSDSNLSNGFKKDKSVKFTGKLAHVALVCAMINLIVQIASDTMQPADIVIVVAAVFTNAVMKVLWEKEKKEKNLVGSVWHSKSRFDI